MTNLRGKYQIKLLSENDTHIYYRIYDPRDDKFTINKVSKDRTDVLGTFKKDVHANLTLRYNVGEKNIIEVEEDGKKESR